VEIVGPPLSGPIARNRAVAKTIRILPACLEGRQKLFIWCILRKEGLANIMPPIGPHCPDLIHSQPLVSGTQASSKSDTLMFRAPPARPLLTS
jgi:hypothetical protein